MKLKNGTTRKKKSSIEFASDKDGKVSLTEVSYDAEDSSIHDSREGDVEQSVSTDLSDKAKRSSGPLTRTDRLLLEYRMFKAARKIQTAARRWYAQLIYKRKRAAAITIQRFWRGFYYRRYFFRMLEDELQKRIVQHYTDSAIRIQAWWRGWRVRLYIHDHYALLRAQVRAAEELLHCVAYKLHYLLRTHQIPGIFSLRNTHALSKVEKLLAAMSFKHYSPQTQLFKRQKEQELNSVRKCYEKPAFYNCMPLQGPEIGTDAKCRELYRQQDADERMLRILKTYKDSLEEDPRVARFHKCLKDAKSKKKRPSKSKKPQATFCTDVINSLSRWRILSPSNTNFNPESLRNPEYMDGFLSEIRSIYDRMVSDPCVCFAFPR